MSRFDHLRGKSLTYENLKRVALEAGRFSVFEATETQQRARLFDRLCKDPEIDTETLTFPWTAVRKKGA
jgi:predicted kinase